MRELRRVAVFDVDLPPGVAFLRSLGRAGVPVATYGSHPLDAGRFSRFAGIFHRCPPVDDLDAFVDWLTQRMVAGEIDLVAPTSDFVVFAAAEAHRRSGRCDDIGLPPQQALLDCLLKHRFAAAMDAAGLPTPQTAAPHTLDEALDAAGRIGYPVVLKPRSHLGVGRARGDVVRGPTELRRWFAAYPLGSSATSVRTADPDLALPLVQAFVEPIHGDVISICGCLDEDGRTLAVRHSRKLRQWPPPMGVGTLFEVVGHQPYTDRALDAVRSVLGRGLFELELLVSRRDGSVWPIDLNPRTYGQVSLDIANGADLPRLWYGTCCAAVLRPAKRAEGARFWTYGLPYVSGAAVGLLKGPGRRAALRDLRRVFDRPYVGAMYSRTDPLPAVVSGLRLLLHPGGLVRPFLKALAERQPDGQDDTTRSGRAMVAVTVAMGAASVTVPTLVQHLV